MIMMMIMMKKKMEEEEVRVKFSRYRPCRPLGIQ
jgi:hypothetical protein